MIKVIIKPTVTDLLKKVDNRFELVTMTSKRARQISSGSMVLTKKITKRKKNYWIKKCF